MRMRSSKKIYLWSASLLGTLVVVAVVAGLWLRAQIRGSLPRLDGQTVVEGLRSAVKIERDAEGVPTIRAGNRQDLARALGYLHAQDRFFQMDLMRRQAAGELAALFGPPAVPLDRESRLHRFRSRAELALENLDHAHRDILAAYTGGVNAGLRDLAARPVEYLLLRNDPAPWRDTDSILVLYAMFLLLNMDYGSGESTPATLYHTLPRPVADWLFQAGCEWDAPVVGEPYASLPIPGPEIFDLRRSAEGDVSPGGRVPAEQRSPRPVDADDAANTDDATDAADDAGSNNWAVAGSRSGHGRALLANDMHLGLRVPNTWYRVVMIWPDESTGDGQRHKLVGMTLPGGPSLVAGSNGRVAWGFTNSYGDWIDLVVVERDQSPGSTAAEPARPPFDYRYRTPDGPREFGRETEIITVKGAPPDTLTIVTTIWGPIVGADPTGRPYAMRWIAHEPDGANLNLLRLEMARNLDEALAVASRCGVPPQNFVCADSAGRIGWTIIGLIPQRTGFSGRLPTSWADGGRCWDGWLATERYPRIVDPDSGLIWTANARVVDGEMLRRMGDGGFALGARAKQIRDDLLALPAPTELDLLAVQLDDRALFLERWRELLFELAAVNAEPAGATGVRQSDTANAVSRSDSATVANRTEFFRLVRSSWDGHASIGSVGYRLVRAFRRDISKRIYTWLTAACTRQDTLFDFTDLPQREGVVWQLVTRRPAHLLGPRFATWDEALLASVDSTTALFTRAGRSPASRTWGERNTTRIQHPLSLAVPPLGRWLDMEPRQLPGGSHMPRVVHPTSGASHRLVVSPGYEQDGIFHMPTGQCGHPFSPFYRAGHRAWEEGRPTPLLPGPGRHLLVLRPGSVSGE